MSTLDPRASMGSRAKWTGNPKRCSNPKCTTAIGPGEFFLMDRMADANYCEPCGKALRYHRVKSHERGENLPITFADVENRQEQS